MSMHYIYINVCNNTSFSSNCWCNEPRTCQKVSITFSFRLNFTSTKVMKQTNPDSYNDVWFLGNCLKTWLCIQRLIILFSKKHLTLDWNNGTDTASLYATLFHQSQKRDMTTLIASRGSFIKNNYIVLLCWMKLNIELLYGLIVEYSSDKEINFPRINLGRKDYQLWKN